MITYRYNYAGQTGKVNAHSKSHAIALIKEKHGEGHGDVEIGAGA